MTTTITLKFEQISGYSNVIIYKAKISYIN